MPNTYLNTTGKTIFSLSGKDFMLDQYIKQILACKPILACILHETVQECRNMTLEEIACCIEGDVIISPVKNTAASEYIFQSEKISGFPLEAYETDAGLIEYDVRTTILLPGHTAEYVKILIDIESQKEDKPGYDIPLRALFYCCRMISSQLDHEFTNSSNDPVKYGNLKKVYSIWICSNTAQLRANSIDQYTINRKTIFGRNPDHPRYDLLSAIIINVGHKHQSDKNSSQMFRMLNTLFDTNIHATQKIAELKNNGIAVTKKIEKEVCEMFAYTADVLQTGYNNGYNNGVKKGETKLRILLQKLRQENLTDEINRVIADENYAETLYRKYNIQ